MVQAIPELHAPVTCRVLPRDDNVPRLTIVSTLPLRWGGSEELWADTAREALAAGWEVRACITELASSEPQVLALAKAGVQFVFRREPRTKPLTLTQRMARRLRRSMRLNSPAGDQAADWQRIFGGSNSVVLVSQGGTYCALSMPGLVPRLVDSALPYVVLCQSCRERVRVPECQRAEASAFLARAARVAFVADDNRRMAMLQLAVQLPNAIVVQNPVNLQDTSEVPWPANSARVALACVARLEVADKGQDLLLQALTADEWKSRHWHCAFFGAGPDEAYLRDLARNLNLDDRVTFAGHVKDVRQIWGGHELLVLPSRSEGTPLSLVEAMLCGRPALVTQAGGNAEWVQDGVTGFVAEAITCHSLHRALERAVTARERWPLMGEAARRECLRKRDPKPGLTLFNLLSKHARHGKSRQANPPSGP